MSRVFTSGTQRINTPASAVYNSMPTWSVAAWIFPTSIVAANAVILSKAINTGLEFNLSAGLSIRLQASIFCSVSPASTTSSVTLPTNAWTHVAATFNTAGDNKIRLYINGAESAYLSQVAAVGTVPNDSALGFEIGSDGSNGMRGRIAEAAVWNSVLTGTQIAALAAGTTGVPGSLPAPVAYWHLLGTTSPEPDSSGNNNVGTLQNAPAQGPDSPGYSAPVIPIANGFLGSVTVVGSADPGDSDPFLGTFKVIAGIPTGVQNPYLGHVRAVGSAPAGQANPTVGQVVVIVTAPAGVPDPYLGNIIEG